MEKSELETVKTNLSDTIGRGATTKKQAIALLQKPVHIGSNEEEIRQ